MNIPEEFKELMQKMLNDDKKVVERSVPIQAKWQPLIDELLQLKEAASAITSKLETKRNLMWATIESDLDIYDKSLRLNKETNEIEIMGSAEAVKLSSGAVKIKTQANG